MGYTDDVKVTDIRGHSVKLVDLDAQSLATLARFIHRACVHFTVGSDPRLRILTLFARPDPLSLRLYEDSTTKLEGAEQGGRFNDANC